MILIDSHLDLSWNALGWNRDLRRTVAEIRAAETGMTDPGRKTNTVCFPEMRRGEIAICVATLLARCHPHGRTFNLDFRTREIAYSVAQGQLAYYRALAEDGVCRLVRDRAGLKRSFDEWKDAAGQPGAPNPASASGVANPTSESGATNPASASGAANPTSESGATNPASASGVANPTSESGATNPASAPGAANPTSGVANPPFGFIVSMEGADPILSPSHIGRWWEDGLRAIGPAHYGPSAYAHGTGCSGGLTPMGRELLRAMEEAGMILDLTHLADESFWEALKIFHGPVLASHNNCRALVPGDRQYSDDQVRAIVERDGVIGAVFDAWMLVPDWKISRPNTATLESAVDQIDHICQLAGSARHIAIGSDLDGGYGTEQSPTDLDTIADLQKIPAILRKRGYAEPDIEGIFHGNWMRFFEGAWAKN